MLQELPENPTLKPHPAQATYDLHKATRQEAFLAAYAQCGTILQAAKASGIERKSVYLWREDPAFVDRMTKAHEAFGDLLQEYALEKVKRLESKDNLLHLAMLNAHVPQLYAPERQRFTLQDNRSVTIINNFPTGPRQLAMDYIDAVGDKPTDSVATPLRDSVTDTDDESLSVDE